MAGGTDGPRCHDGCNWRDAAGRRGGAKPYAHRVASIDRNAVTFVVVDDDDDIRLLVRILSRTTPAVELVGEAADGDQGLSVVAETQPHAVLLDLHMAVSGIEILRTIKHVAPDTGVLAWTGDPVALRTALAGGADDGCLKTTPWQEVVDRLVALATSYGGSVSSDLAGGRTPVYGKLDTAAVTVLNAAPFQVVAASNTLWPCPSCGTRRPLAGSWSMTVRNRQGPAMQRTVLVCAVCAETLRPVGAGKQPDRRRGS